MDWDLMVGYDAMVNTASVTVHKVDTVGHDHPVPPAWPAPPGTFRVGYT